MVKILRTLLVTLIVVAAVNADDDDGPGMTLEDVVGAMEPFGAGCDPVPDRVHIEELVMNKEDAHRTTKCFRYCLMTQFELINEGETQMNQAKTVEMMGMMFPDKDDEMNAVTAKCNTDNAAITDTCDVAHAHGMCLLKELKERGFDIPEIK